MKISEIKTYRFKDKSSFLVTAPHDSTHESNGFTMLKHNYIGKKPYRDYDPNSGEIAKHVANFLGANLLVLTNAKKDYNKDINDFYVKYINKLSPRFLIEIHTHEEKHVSDVEISMGEKNSVLSVLLASMIQDEFINSGDFETYVDGEYDSIFYKATKTSTVNGFGYNFDETHRTIHIEIPQSLADKNYLKDGCKTLGNIISNGVMRFLHEYNEIELFN